MNWKKIYLDLFNNTPKKNRKTISQINTIKSNAKLLTSIYGNEVFSNLRKEFNNL